MSGPRPSSAFQMRAWPAEKRALVFARIGLITKQNAAPPPLWRRQAHLHAPGNRYAKRLGGRRCARPCRKPRHQRVCLQKHPFAARLDPSDRPNVSARRTKTPPLTGRQTGCAHLGGGAAGKPPRGPQPAKPAPWHGRWCLWRPAGERVGRSPVPLGVDEPGANPSCCNCHKITLSSNIAKAMAFMWTVNQCPENHCFTMASAGLLRTLLAVGLGSLLSDCDWHVTFRHI